MTGSQAMFFPRPFGSYKSALIKRRKRISLLKRLRLDTAKKLAGLAIDEERHAADRREYGGKP